MSITDHDSIDCQERATALAKEYGIIYITDAELNATFQYSDDKKRAKVIKKLSINIWPSVMSLSIPCHLLKHQGWSGTQVAHW